MKRWTGLEPARLLPIVVALVLMYAVAGLAAGRSFADLKAQPMVLKAAPAFLGDPVGSPGNGVTEHARPE